MTADTLLTGAHREAALSRAYVRAVAGFAGYTVSEEDFDRDGIDLRIHAGGDLGPSIGLQLKATVNLGNVQSDGCYRYDVPVKKLWPSYQALSGAEVSGCLGVAN